MSDIMTKQHFVYVVRAEMCRICKTRDQEIPQQHITGHTNVKHTWLLSYINAFYVIQRIYLFLHAFYVIQRFFSFILQLQLWSIMCSCAVIGRVTRKIIGIQRCGSEIW